MLSRFGAAFSRTARMPILFQIPIRRTFCDPPQTRLTLYEEIVNHPSVFSRFFLSWSSLGIAGLVAYGFSCTSMFSCPKKVENSFAYAERVRWRIMSSHGHLLIALGIGGLSLLTMYRSGCAARLALWPKVSFSLSLLLSAACLFQIASMEYAVDKFAFFMFTAGVLGMAGAPMINFGVKVVGDVFLRMVMFAVIIYGHCAAVASVAPNEEWLDIPVKVGAALGAVSAFSISYMFLPPYPIYLTIPLLCFFSFFGIRTIDRHSKMLFENIDNEDRDPINEGCQFVIDTIQDFVRCVKILKPKDDD